MFENSLIHSSVGDKNPLPIQMQQYVGVTARRAVIALGRARSVQHLSSFPVFVGYCIISRICPKPESDMWETHIAKEPAAG